MADFSNALKWWSRLRNVQLSLILVLVNLVLIWLCKWVHNHRSLSLSPQTLLKWKKRWKVKSLWIMWCFSTPLWMNKKTETDWLHILRIKTYRSNVWCKTSHICWSHSQIRSTLKPQKQRIKSKTNPECLSSEIKWLF